MDQTRRRRPLIPKLDWVEKKRGGRRPGAGRPPVDSVTIKINLETTLWAHAQQYGGQDLIRELLEEHRRQFNSRQTDSAE